MLSRVADAVYWMARYVERAENLARFIDVTLNVTLDVPGSAGETWRPLVLVTGDADWFARQYAAASPESVIRFLTFDREYPNSVLSCLSRARENARSVREAISSEMWEHLNQFYHAVRTAAGSEQVFESPCEFFHEVRMASHLFQGLTDSTMSHGEAWHFAQLGKLLERADKTSRILDVKSYLLLPTRQDVGTPTDDLQWSAVLRSVSGLEMYRKRHHGITPPRVIDFLVLDRLFPRAVQHCVAAADDCLHAISGTPPGSTRNIAERRLGELRSDLAATQVDDILARGLPAFLDTLQTRLNTAGDGIHETFITLRPVEATA